MTDRVSVEAEGEVREVAAGTAVGAVAPADRTVLAALWNGQPVDLARPVRESGHVHWLRFTDDAGRHVFRHSSAHLLAQAVKRLWPEARLGTGPALEDGFYYDIWTPTPLTAEDLPRIEAAMRDIVREDLGISRQELTREEARALFAARNEPFKLEIIERLPEDAVISVYRQGEFVDLCAGPHVPSTGVIQALKLTNVSGAYWRGDEANPMMTRIYGTSFPDEEGLTQYLERLEEARRRDHRRLGRELNLFQLRDEAPGFVFWLPKGMHLYRQLEEFSRAIQAPLGYQEVSTPWIYRAELWKRSGHWAHFRDNMFVIAGDHEEMAVKPMNCPGHCLLFGSQTRSYRDLPIKWAEYGPLARFERSGTLNGLLRVRGLHQDDAHLYIRPDQIQEQIVEVVGLVELVGRTFDLGSMEIEFSTRPDQYLGDAATWDHAESELEEALRASGRPYRINPGDGAFYGPKLDFYATDALGRRWQLSTVQLDYQLPEQFDLEYVDQDGQRRRPVMIHRAIMGSLERFIGILVEHYAGAFPLWLAPEQVRVLPVTEAEQAYAQRVADDLTAAGLRASVDLRNEKLGWRVRAAQVEKVPVMLVAGRREVESGQVAVRTRDGDLGGRPWPGYLEELRREARRPGS
jgi:threonyl-tRNA synthetase